MAARSALLAAACAACSLALRAPEDAPAPTFSGGVAALVHRACTPCHHEGGAGPFPLESYEQVRRRARQIAVVTGTRFMPPWKPDPGFRRFLDERVLSDEEIDLLARWAREGAPLGDASAVPAAPEIRDTWVLGEPDLVLRMPEAYPVPAEGKDDYRSFVVPTGFESARHVRAFDFEPDNRPSVHHIITLLDTSGAARARDEATPGVGYEGMIALGELFGAELNAWVPGTTPLELPPGSAWTLPPGTDLVLDTHMQTRGKVEPVKVAIGVYFAERPPEDAVVNVSMSSDTLCIPPGDDSYVADFSFRLPVAVTALAVQPHAHYVGKDLRAEALLPDGALVPLIRIPDWDFSWQDSYRFVEPIDLPADTLVRMRFVYDNSAGNERNPFQPPRRILSGPRSEDEMGLVWLTVRVPGRDAAALTAAVRRNQDAIDERDGELQQVINGIVYGFDTDRSGALDAEEDARATAYVNDLPDHPHGRVFDRDHDGRLDERERAFLERVIACWNGTP